jgi:uncharacterized protein YvpB
VLGLGTDDVYSCDGTDAPTVATACPQGCNPAVTACYQASCAGRSDGKYCGSDEVDGNPTVVYVCQGGAVASFGKCPGLCIREPSGVDDACGPTIPTDVRAAAGDGLAVVRWTPAGTAQTGFTVTASPGGVTAQAPSNATGLTNGIGYTFTITQDGGMPSAATAAVTPSPNANVVTDVLHHPQTRNLTCEEASLVMALSHAGISRTEDDVLNDIGIDWTAATFDTNGFLHWGDPYKSFVGDPDGLETSYTGYGTYWPNIQRAAVDFGAMVVQAGEGTSPASLYAAILAGHPAVVWVTGNFQVYTRQNTWITDDGQTIGWYGPAEHAVTVVGVDDTTVIIDNPLNPVEWQRVAKTTFEAVYAVYNQAAVVVQ